jgi:amidase
VELWERTAVDLAASLRAGEVSAVEVLEAHLDRIAATNPSVNAIITLVPERAIARARSLDAAFARGEPPGPLHGLPIAHKDLVNTAGIRTTFGSRIYADNVPETDDLLVERIRAAGAVVVGKTNTPEFGAGSATFNPVFGATRNPHGLAWTAGGSSGGAAAALASGMVPIADGSDLGGSLRNPAAFCEVVGFRPTPGRVPSWPNDRPEDDLSVEGPMGRTVADAALLLSVMAGPDPRVPISTRVPGRGGGFAPPLDPPPEGLRIAWAPDAAGTIPIEPEVVDVVANAAPRFEAIGARLRSAFPDLHDAREIFLTLRAAGFVADLAEEYRHHRELLKPTVVWNIEQGLALTPEQIQRAMALHAALRERVDRFFDDVDVLVLPTTQVAPFDGEIEYPTEVAGEPMETYLDWMASCWIVTVTGCPAISVPCGRTAEGKPVGLQIVGRRGDDLGVLRVAAAFERTGSTPGPAHALA